MKNYHVSIYDKLMDDAVNMKTITYFPEALSRKGRSALIQANQNLEMGFR